MHEMGIASSILEAVQKEVLRYPGYRAAKVDVRIGEFAGVDAESVRFCFDAIVKGSPLAPLELGIVLCGGDELDLGFIELVDDDENRGADSVVRAGPPGSAAEPTGSAPCAEEAPA